MLCHVRGDLIEIISTMGKVGATIDLVLGGGIMIESKSTESSPEPKPLGVLRPLSSFKKQYKIQFFDGEWAVRLEEVLKSYIYYTKYY